MVGGGEGGENTVGNGVRDIRITWILYGLAEKCKGLLSFTLNSRQCFEHRKGRACML